MKESGDPLVLRYVRRLARRARDYGQGSLEFVGVVVLASILVGATVWTVAQHGEAIRATVSTKICEITGGSDCGEVPPVEDATLPGEGPVPTYLDPSLTPQQRAESGEYVALGDSFSSGEGGSEYDPRTDENYEGRVEDYYDNLDEDGTPQDRLYCHAYGCVTMPAVAEKPYHNVCHRSEGAYPQQVADGFTFRGGYTFAACSGAVTADFTRPNGQDDDEPWKGNQGELPQLDHLGPETSLVTFTIGGNDAKFADTLIACLGAGSIPFKQCLDDDDEQAEADANIDQAIANLRELLPQVRQRAENARVLVVGYPQFFPDDPGSSWSDGTTIDSDDIRRINELVGTMNDEIEQLVEELNAENPGSFEFVDVEDAFEGCYIGQSDACMNNVSVRFSDGKPDEAGSYHPNDRGHDRVAEIVEEAIRDGS